MTADPDECSVKWCNEAGEHSVHRHYLTSLPTWGGAWLVGVNVVQSNFQLQHVELTATARRGGPAIVSLQPDEAEAVGQSLVEAAARAARSPADSTAANQSSSV